MSDVFLEYLDGALDDVQMSYAHYDDIECCVSKVCDLKNQIKKVEEELREVIDKMCADIAVEVRQLNPNLQVVIRTNCCDVHYRSKSISCQVKPFEKCWYFDATEFGKRFSKRYPQCCKLDCSISDLSHCLNEFYRQHFRSLA